MRILILGALVLSVSGAAWAGERAGSCGYVSDSAAIERRIEGAVARAMAAVERSALEAAAVREIETDINAALAELERELAGLEDALERAHAVDEAALETRIEVAVAHADRDLEGFEPALARSDAIDEAAVEARVEAALEALEASLELVADEIDAAAERSHDLESGPKRWRPRY